MEAAILAGGALGFGSLVFMFISYFLPWIIALLRGTNSNGLIFLVNLLIGWTVIGWVICLIWSICAARRNNVQTIIIKEAK